MLSAPGKLYIRGLEYEGSGVMCSVVHIPPGCSGYRSHQLRTANHRKYTYKELCDIVCLSMHLNVSATEHVLACHIGSMQVPIRLPMTQQSSAELCLATSSPDNEPTSFLSLLSRFIFEWRSIKQRSGLVRGCGNALQIAVPRTEQLESCRQE